MDIDIPGTPTTATAHTVQTQPMIDPVEAPATAIQPSGNPLFQIDEEIHDSE